MRQRLGRGERRGNKRTRDTKAEGNGVNGVLRLGMNIIVAVTVVVMMVMVATALALTLRGASTWCRLG